MSILWSINEYDRDGDVSEKGVYLHFGNTRILVAKTVALWEIELKVLNNALAEMREEEANCD